MNPPFSTFSKVWGMPLKECWEYALHDIGYVGFCAVLIFLLGIVVGYSMH